MNALIRYFMGNYYGEPVQTAVAVEATFYFPRPKSHLLANGDLTKKAPPLKTTAPDLDKLARCLLDAGSGYLYQDDKQIVSINIDKQWTIGQPRTKFSFYEVATVRL